MNKQVTQQQVQEVRKGIVIQHTEDNRSKRRSIENTGALLNKRKHTKGRKPPHAVLCRMSYFSLMMSYKRNR